MKTSYYIHWCELRNPRTIKTVVDVDIKEIMTAEEKYNAIFEAMKQKTNGRIFQIEAIYKL
jgi:hypothetical protein